MRASSSIHARLNLPLLGTSSTSSTAIVSRSLRRGTTFPSCATRLPPFSTPTLNSRPSSTTTRSSSSRSTSSTWCCGRHLKLGDATLPGIARNSEGGVLGMRIASHGFAAHSEPVGGPSQSVFTAAAEETLSDLQDKLEMLEGNPNVDEFDMQYSDGVLTVKLGSKGTYVINKQTPNRQIWFSSPIRRYDYTDGQRWACTRDGHSLHDRLSQEIKQLCGVDIS